MATELAKAYVQIVPTAQGIKGAIEQELGGAASSAGKSSGDSLGKNLVGALKGAIAAAGIGTFVKSALEAGGNIQQSFGGLDTIYGEEAAAGLQNYARLAAEAGISANDYAEQAVSFGAALKDAYGGDTVKAAEAANAAIMAVADNSAKMGTDIGSVQAAFQGFAKGQYTLLDNLKLGYGGTKSEMERLLADAEKFSGIKYDINNLGDVYSAIGVIQEKLGVAGVAAEEAKTTFSGSFGAMKAAATNFLASLALGEGVGFALGQLLTTFQTFVFNNLLPLLGNIVTSIPEAVAAAAPIVMESISNLFAQAPELLAAGTEMLHGLVEGITTGLPELVSMATEIITDFATALVEGAPQILQEGYNLALELMNGLLNGLPSILASLGEMMNQLITLVLENAPKFLEQGANFILQMISGIVSKLPDIVTSIGQLIGQLLQTIVSHLPEILAKGVEIVGKLVEGLIQAIPQIVAAIPQLIAAIVQGFTGKDWKSVGSDVIHGIINGITGGIGALKDAVKDAASRALDAAKSFLGINSPSRVFRDQVGAMMAEGMAEGFEDNVPTAEIQTALKPMANIVPDAFGGSQYSYGGFTINVYGAPGQDVNALADIISDRINAQIARGRAVFA